MHSGPSYSNSLVDDTSVLGLGPDVLKEGNGERTAGTFGLGQIVPNNQNHLLWLVMLAHRDLSGRMDAGTCGGHHTHSQGRTHAVDKSSST